MSSTSTPDQFPPDTSRGRGLLIVRWLTMSIAILFVSLRFYVRGFLRKNLGWDDYTVLLAGACAIAGSIFSTFQVYNGFGRNIHYLTPVQIQHFGLYTNICIMLITIGTGLVRISVCIFVLRLVPAMKMSYRRWMWALLAFCTIVSVAEFLAQCFQCIPLIGLWDKSVKARCFEETDMTTIAKVQGGSAAITDLLCVLFPIMVCRNLQVSRRDKMAIFFIFGLGFLPTATAIARTVAVSFTSKNPTWDLIPDAIYACLEQNIGITVASMPALRQLIIMRKYPYPYHPSESVYTHHHNTRPPLDPFVRLSDSDRIRLPDYGSPTKTSSRDFSAQTPETRDVESRHDTRASLIRLSIVSPPLWIDRKISSAETIEMSRVSPTTTTFVAGKPSSAERLRLSMVAPSWGHRKTSSTDKACTQTNKRLSMISPSTVDPPPSPFSAAKAPPLGKFDETGLRHSRVATAEELMSLGNPAALGYSCKIEGGTPKGSPKPSPKLTP